HLRVSGPAKGIDLGRSFWTQIDQVEGQASFLGGKSNDAGSVLIAFWIKDDDALAIEGGLDQHHGGHDTFAGAGGADDLHVGGVVLLPRDVHGLAAIIKTYEDALVKGEIAARLIGRQFGFIEALANV